jgi:antitoxin PrlF
MSLIIERSKITGKGQVQIPAKIREAAKVKIGDEVAFSLDEKGKIEVEFIRKKPLTEFAGSLTGGKAFPGFEEEERQARQMVAEKAAEDYE